MSPSTSIGSPRRLETTAAMLALVAALVAVAGTPAFAAEAKHAIPVIAKHVSADSQGYHESVAVNAGAQVRYRLTLTMPETAESLERLVYVVTDKPDAVVKPDATKVSARIVNAQGKEKARLSPKAGFSRNALTIDLGDIKAACHDLEFGDLAIVEYPAIVSAAAQPGEYPNVARLHYDEGDGFRDTVDVMATVIVPSGPQPARAAATATALPKTGDAPPPIGAAITLAAAVALFALAATRRERSGLEEWVSPPSRPHRF